MRYRACDRLAALPRSPSGSLCELGIMRLVKRASIVRAKMELVIAFVLGKGYVIPAIGAAGKSLVIQEAIPAGGDILAHKSMRAFYRILRDLAESHGSFGNCYHLKELYIGLVITP